MKTLRDGLRLSAVLIQREGGGVDTIRVGIGPHEARGIVVSMESGALGTLPWARVEMNDGCTSMVNLSMICGVVIPRDGDAGHPLAQPMETKGPVAG